MIRIAVCDDQMEMNKMLSRMVDRVLKRNGITALISEFCSGEDFLKQVQDTDMVFLDIEMPSLDGIEVGERIQKQNPDCKIVIASAREDLLPNKTPCEAAF